MTDGTDKNGEDHGRLVRGDREVALDAVVTACHAAQVTHARGAELAQAGSDAAERERLARERAAQYEALTAAMRGAGLTPKAPDPEREAVDAVIDRAVALMEGDERQAAAERSNLAERDLAEALDEARRYSNEPGVAKVLDEMAAARR